MSHTDGVPCCMPGTGGLRCILLLCILFMQVSMWEEKRGDIGGKGEVGVGRVRKGGGGGTYA